VAAARDIARLRELCEQLVRRAEVDPASAGALADGVAGLLAIHAKASHVGAKPPRRTGRRDAPLLDPFEIYREDPDRLTDRLSALDLEQLRDIVAFYGMDPRRLVMSGRPPTGSSPTWPRRSRPAVARATRSARPTPPRSGGAAANEMAAR
jgi:hypothetical protein